MGYFRHNARGLGLLSANFGFLQPHGAQLYRLAALAEHYFPTDANTCLLKLRQFAELLALEQARLALAITHAPAHMLITDVPLGVKLVQEN